MRVELFGSYATGCATGEPDIDLLVEFDKHPSDRFREEFPGNELRMARTRDVYAQDYYSLSFERVYETAKDDYPRVKRWIESALGDVR